ncbi:YciI family protein [Devosia sp. BK]|uniref:YciI family protein n=1 Tax=Devosia sp. BK TaxID=2871706 RepID=UPI00293A5FB1|nr:YciI family protein [Devosia sp. BK]MDV3250846.1 YciI family protein [Devosia sp. BK]
MKFLCLFNFAPNAFDGVTPEEMRRLDDATIEHDQKLRRSGHLLLASPLEDVATERVIDRRRHLKVAQTDGPFAETKEVIGGVVLIEAKDMDEALALFADDPIAAYCRIQIRPLKEDHRHSETGESRPEFRAP